LIDLVVFIGIGLAVMAEQMPQELGTLAILINSGLGLRRTLIFSIVPMVLSFLGFTAGVYLDNLDDSYDGLIFAVSAGMYLYIVLGTLLPEIREQFNEELRTDMRKATVTTLLQICGIFSGLSLMFLMNVHNEEI
jgi:zinc transporter ZupT